MQEQALEAGTQAEVFETIYRRLEEAVERLESGGLSLEESITLYESGMRLAQRCKTMLSSAELRISELQEEFAEDATVTEPEPDEDSLNEELG